MLESWGQKSKIEKERQIQCVHWGNKGKWLNKNVLLQYRYYTSEDTDRQSITRNIITEGPHKI